MIYLDIESRSAHFRNHFYNSSLISYPYPTRTMIFGLLASMLGYSHDTYHSLFLNSKIAVCIKSQNLYKDTVVVNHREPTQMARATQVYIEYVKSLKGKVCYRIYYEGEAEKGVLSSLKNYNGYHLYLGATECLASITDFNYCTYKDVSVDKSQTIDSNIPLNIVEKIEISGVSDYTPKYERYRNIYGWKEERGQSLGSFDMLCETNSGKIRCTLKKNMEFTIAELADGEERKIKGKLLKTSKGDVIYAF